MLLRVKILRQVRGHTQFDVSQATGIAQSRLSLLERGLVQATPNERERLAQLLRAPTASLFRTVRFSERQSSKETVAGAAAN